MPAPSAFDPWLASRRFGVVIDAGSSGSRLQIYSWKDARVVRDEQGQSVANSLPKVEKGSQTGDDWITKAEPGISSFGENPEGVASYLAPLLVHAQNVIPPSLHSETPLFLLATAGMRLLPREQQQAVLAAVCDFIRFHSNFKIDPPSSQGKCGSSVRIISGEDEGLFGWIAVNYLMDGFGQHASNARATYGFLDMGGASTQIAFEPSKSEREKHKDNLVTVRLRLLGGDDIQHQVFVTTWLGYGTNQARERYVGQAISNYEVQRTSTSHDQDKPEKELVPDPCLPVGLTMTETPVHTGPSTSHSRKPHTLLGTGSFEHCLKNTAPLLNKNAPCPNAPCLFNGVHVPRIDFSVSHFIGVSEYWYSSEHVFGLGGAYDVVQYEGAASEFCAQKWGDLLQQHEASREAGHLGGDGQVESGGKVVGAGKWGKEVELSRLEMQCFKAAWIVNVLHEGIGLPRIVDPGGNRTSQNDGHDIDQKASQKGLGPTFQSVDTIGDTAISWTLGKMVLEASKEIPASSGSTEPLHDPLDTHRPEENTLSSLEPTPANRSWDRLLSPSLTLSRLSLFPILIYVTIFSVIFFLICRLRHRVRTTLRRLSRGSFKREKPDLIFDAEEGRPGTGISRPSTPFSSSPPSPTGTSPPPNTFQRILSIIPLLRRVYPPLRVSSSPRPTTHIFPPSSPAFPAASRSGSSTPTNFEDAVGLSHPLSRSRNSSQMNLAPRTVPYSRSVSAQQIPTFA